MKSLDVFRKLCGDSTLQNVVICIIMRGEIDSRVGDIREMTEEFFKPVPGEGARMGPWLSRSFVSSSIATLHCCVFRYEDMRTIKEEVEQAMKGKGRKGFFEKANKRIQRKIEGAENGAVTERENSLLVGTQRQRQTDGLVEAIRGVGSRLSPLVVIWSWDRYGGCE